MVAGAAYKAKPNEDLAVSWEDVLAKIGSDTQIVDARGAARFYAKEPVRWHGATVYKDVRFNFFLASYFTGAASRHAWWSHPWIPQCAVWKACEPGRLLGELILPRVSESSGERLTTTIPACSFSAIWLTLRLPLLKQVSAVTTHSPRNELLLTFCLIDDTYIDVKTDETSPIITRCVARFACSSTRCLILMQPVVYSCGSGVTASVLTFGLHLAGKPLDK